MCQALYSESSQHTELSIVSQMKKGGLETLNLFIRLLIKYLNTFCVPGPAALMKFMGARHKEKLKTDK